MNRLIHCLCVFCFIISFAYSLYAQANFSTSIHSTRGGKNYFYGADTSVTGAPVPGFETLTGVPITNENLGCISCHPGDNLDANGDAYPVPYPGANCVDCHATNTSGMPVTQEDCFGCHGRQKTTIMALGYSDVHRDGENPLKCWDCHKKEELHGDDGIQYNSAFEPGAIKASCEECHNDDAGTLPDHSSYDPHGGKLACDACHTQSIISCYNCHFESQVENHIKRAKQPIHDFIILVNREKDGKVGTASFQSLSYQGHTWVAFGPFHGHTTMEDGRGCSDCHANFGGQIEAIQQYNSTGEIQFAKWNTSDSTLSWVHGVVPFPADYERSFKMEFITYNGNTSDPAGPSKNWSSIGKNTWDGHQLFFATPLSKVQMAKIGFDTTKTTAVENRVSISIPGTHELKQNYPNPFNPSTTIEFQLDKATSVTIKIYDVRGSEISTLLAEQRMSSGVHKIPFTAAHLGSGTYFYKIITPEFTSAKKMILLK